MASAFMKPIMAACGIRRNKLGHIQQTENHLYRAADRYCDHQVLETIGTREHLQRACVAHDVLGDDGHSARGTAHHSRLATNGTFFVMGCGNGRRGRISLVLFKACVCVCVCVCVFQSDCATCGEPQEDRREQTRQGRDSSNKGEGNALRVGVCMQAIVSPDNSSVRRLFMFAL